jgi:hypothetical protein
MSVNDRQSSACIAVRKQWRTHLIVDMKIESPAEPGCKQILTSMQNYFANFAI